MCRLGLISQLKTCWINSDIVMRISLDIILIICEHCAGKITIYFREDRASSFYHKKKVQLQLKLWTEQIWENHITPVLSQPYICLRGNLKNDLNIRNTHTTHIFRIEWWRQNRKKEEKSYKSPLRMKKKSLFVAFYTILSTAVRPNV